MLRIERGCYPVRGKQAGESPRVERGCAVKRALVAALAVVCAWGGALAEIPQVMGYQGQVTDNSGVPVADGTYDMQFRIYDNSGGSGSPLWDSGTRSVTLAGGAFGVMLGESPQPALNLSFEQNYWMLVTFDGEDQTPLKHLASTGYAYMASGLVPGTEVSGGLPTGVVLKGTNTSGTGYAGVMGETGSSIGYGVWGKHTAATGQGRGVYGESDANQGCGVMGVGNHSSGSNVGVLGMTMSSSGKGVYGWSWGGGSSVGVQGEASGTWGIGVKGLATSSTSYAYGVYGESQSSGGAGVQGWASASSGTTYGVEGLSSSPSGRGVYGHVSQTSGTNYGVYGSSWSSAGAGVYDEASASSGTTSGVHGKSTSNTGTGVFGEATGTSTCYGVRGVSSNPGVDASYGVYGEASGNGYGVFGKHTLGGWAGGFDGRVLVDGKLIVGATSFVPTWPLEVHGSRAVVYEDSTMDWIAMRTDATRLHLSFEGNDLAIQSTTGMEHVLLNPNRVAYVGIRTTTPAYELQVGNAGDGTTARANAWNTFSSREYKKDIEALDTEDYGEVLRELRETDVVRYKLIDDESGVEHIGLIAEDAPAEIATPDRKGLSLSDYSAFLFAAVKAQQEQIAALEQEVAALRRELAQSR